MSMTTSTFEQQELEKSYKNADRLLQRFMFFLIPVTIGSGLYFGHYVVGFLGTAIYSAIFFGCYYFVEGREQKKYGFFGSLVIVLYVLTYVTEGIFAVNFSYYIFLGFFTFYMDRKLLTIVSIVASIHYLLGYEGVEKALPWVKVYSDPFFGEEGIRLAEFVYTELAIASALFVFSSMARQLKEETKQNINREEANKQEALRLQKDEAFARAIAEGKFEETFDVDEDDRLGQALFEMKNSLKEAEMREENERYVSEGISRINDALRIQGEEIETLADRILEEMVSYLKAVQGILFVKLKNEEQEEVLKAMSLYAYDTRKFVEREIKPGEGLIGQIFLEGQPLYLLDMPEDYVIISSGLGENKPSALYITPLIFNQEIAGVIELAFFEPIPEFQRQFIEQASINIASALLNQVRNVEFRRMFQESQEMNERMRNTEEELRQNMEELKSTQEEMERANKEAVQSVEAERDKFKKELDFYKQEINQKDAEIDMLRKFVSQLQEN